MSRTFFEFFFEDFVKLMGTERGNIGNVTVF